MIQITKGAAPADLVTKGAGHNTSNSLLFDSNSANYLSGAQKIPMTGDYKITSVKKALKACQHNKCCFSEAKFTGDYAHVEHFRPKARVDILGTTTKLFPGYYWLAYDWENLLLCKSVINTGYKKNFFPLYNEGERNRSHHDSYVEQSMIIHPVHENPRSHIVFHKDEPKGITDKGKFNISFLGLRDPAFEEGRRKRFALLQGLKESVDLLINAGFNVDHPTVRKHIDTLKEAVTPQAEFSSMAIDLLEGWPYLAA